MYKEHKKLERLILFSHVAQLLSFSKAAKELGVSRGHLSAQIKKLESEMGIPLLIRTTRHVKLTHAGKNTLQGMDKIHQAILELDRNSVAESQAIEGEIKITAPTLFTNSYLLDIVHNFKKMHPRISFSIDCSYTSYDLSRSDFDLAFRATQYPPENMIVKHILTYQHILCASPHYLASHGTPKKPKDLLNHQCLAGQDIEKWAFDNLDLPLNGWLKINDNALLKQLAINDEGIVKLPDYYVNDAVKAKKLKKILTTELSKTYNIQLIYPQLIHQPNRYKAFIDYTVNYFQQLKNEKPTMIHW